MRAVFALLSLLSLALVQAAPAPVPIPADDSTIDAVNEELKLQARQGGPRATVFNQCTVANRVALTFVSPTIHSLLFQPS